MVPVVFLATATIGCRGMLVILAVVAVLLAMFAGAIVLAVFLIRRAGPGRPEGSEAKSPVGRETGPDKSTPPPA